MLVAEDGGNVGGAGGDAEEYARVACIGIFGSEGHPARKIGRLVAVYG